MSWKQHQAELAEKRKRIGITKRQTRSTAKKLIRNYIENGIHENYGQKEIRELHSKVGRLRLEYRDETQLKVDIRTMINNVTNILFSNGRGRTHDLEVRKTLADSATDELEYFEWKKSNY